MSPRILLAVLGREVPQVVDPAATVELSDPHTVILRHIMVAVRAFHPDRRPGHEARDRHSSRAAIYAPTHAAATIPPNTMSTPAQSPHREANQAASRPIPKIRARPAATMVARRVALFAGSFIRDLPGNER